VPAAVPVVEVADHADPHGVRRPDGEMDPLEAFVIADVGAQAFEVAVVGPFTEQVQVVREALAQAGRPAGEFPVAKRVYLGVDTDAGRARQRMNEALERLYGRRVPDIEAAAIAGTAADCVRELREVAAAGAELILFTALHEPAEHAERIAAEIIPQLG